LQRGSRPFRLQKPLFADIGPAARPEFLAAGHNDVVPADGQKIDHPSVQRDPRDGGLYSRGSADMKGFTASVLAPVPRFLRNSRKTERGASQFLIRLVVRAAPFALLRNTRKTERGASQFLIRLVVRAAPFALLSLPPQEWKYQEAALPDELAPESFLAGWNRQRI
jgi:hypothetical protein